jgi:hypothetical protein
MRVRGKDLRLETIEGMRPDAGVAEAREELWLLGQPALTDYLDYVRRAVVGGEAMERRGLIDAWRAANDVYHALETREDGIADNAERLPLPEAMAEAAAELTASPLFLRTFDRMPTTIEMVELDKIVVSQRRVTKTFVDRLAARLQPRPEPAALFRFCQPLDRRDPPVTIRRLSSERYLFASESNDLRLHAATLFRPEQLLGHEALGPVAGALGLVVGYGSNFLSLIRSEDRVVLHNGYHRAVAMRAAGITHAPCIVQTVTRKDELEVSAGDAVVEDPAFYFRARRPPLLKDFFDPRIVTVLRARPFLKLIEVSFEVLEHNATEV